MGVLSNELKKIKDHMNQAKDVINTKYKEVNKSPIESLTTGELSEKINAIPALDTSDATATPECILENETAYVKGRKETGSLKNYSGSSNSQNIRITGDSDLTDTFTCNISNSGYIDSSTKLFLPLSELKQLGLTSDIIVKGKSFYSIQGTGETGINTDDANATSGDIIKNKTAYVKGKKVTGSLLDYCGTNVNVSTKLNGNAIDITLPAKAVYDNKCAISIPFSKIASLIGLTGSIIKDGEFILGVEGSYSKPPDNNTPDDGEYYNLDAHNFDASMKWGFWEIASDKATDSYNKAKLYRRLYNLYYTNGQINGYRVEGDSTVHAPVYNGSSSERKLNCYTEDLKLNVVECNEVYKKFGYDCPELIKKFGGFSYTIDDKGNVRNMFFDNFDVETLNNYKETCLKSFNEICSILKNTYGISWKGGSKYFDRVGNMTYTVQQKFKIAKVIHDWLVLNNTYGASSIKNLDQTMYPALSKGKQNPVCASYAHAFQWCCQKFGIFTLPILGYAGENHMWNMVTYEPYDCSIVNAKNNPAVWNEIDVTWDDPSTNTTKCKWEFFNTTTAYMQSDAGENRVRARLGVTSYGVESYKDYISDCTCTSYQYKGTVQYGGL